MKRLLLTLMLTLPALAAYSQGNYAVKSLSYVDKDGKVAYSFQYTYNADGTVAREYRDFAAWGDKYTIYYKYDEPTRTATITRSDDPKFLVLYHFLPSFSAYGTHEPWTCVLLEESFEQEDGSDLGCFYQYCYADGKLIYISGEEFTPNSTEEVYFKWDDNGNVKSIQSYGDYYDIVIDNITYSQDPNPFPRYGVNPLCTDMLPNYIAWMRGVAGFRWNSQVTGFTRTTDYGDDNGEKEVIGYSYVKDFTGRVRRVVCTRDGKPDGEFQLTY